MLGRWRTRSAVIGAAIAAVLICAGVAFALTSADFEPRAAQWQETTCTGSLLTAKASAATNQKIATCFAVAKVKEQQTTISSLQASIAKLEASQTPAPLDFTFFQGAAVGKSPLVSPVLDAGKYKTITITSGHSGGVSNVTLEVSNNQEFWLPARSVPSSQSEALSVTGRYYRITASGEAGSGSVSAVAHLTG